MVDNKNPKLIKNGGDGTNIGNFLRNIGKSEILERALNAVGNVASGDYLGAVKALVLNDKDITPDQISEAERMINLDQKDRADARDLQKVALSQEDLFSKRFIYYLTMGILGFSMIIVGMLFFLEIPDTNRDVVNLILGVLVGTGLTGIFNYFYGSSQGSKDKSTELRKRL
tara:strand:+ start:540 stop:1052 length:513 start_codon:yes stop_codon:yes gene_type:complete